MGPEIAVFCEAVDLKSGALLITTSNPALAHQLRLDSERLMQRLNQESRLRRQVRTIRVRVGNQPGQRSR
jgi:hypothetical protein